MVWSSKSWVKVCVVVVAVGLVVGMYAYSRLSYREAGPRVSVTSPPLEFSMGLDKVEFQYGENITIRFRLENVGNQTIRIRRGQPPIWPPEYMETSYYNAYSHGLPTEFHFGFRITHVNGTEIHENSRGVLSYSYEFHMDPGGWIEQAIIYDYYSEEFWGAWNGYQLPTGTYQMRGVFHHMLNSGPRCTLETPSITFAIR